MFSTVLVANRGEIAVRVIRTLRSMGIRSVAIYSDADAAARHVREADLAVRVGPAAARDSYLRIDAVIAAAVATGAEAVHPGYGFLSENTHFAEACAAAGLVFIGPPPSAITAMGDKINAKRTVSAAGVRVVPGGGSAGMSDAELIAVAHQVGFPVLLKPSAGGGGKGMRLVADGHGTVLAEAIVSARREALSSFGDDTLLVERFIERPRHIEIQILADTHGTVLHLGERECSLQRRHQKIIEEAPSPFITPDVRAAMGTQAVAAAQACGYVGAGTIEMIVSGEDANDFFFMEMNTRLQVEHPVTEMVSGIDLVEWQVRVAAGEALPWAQSDLVASGHAIEARLYAEDPARGFLPTGGIVLGLREPSGVGIRVDSGIAVGSVIGSDYDPMLAKIIAHGPDRTTALRRLEHALAATAVVGVGTNSGFLRALLGDPDVAAGRLNTGLVEDRIESLVGDGLAPTEAIVAAALWRIGGGSSATPATGISGGSTTERRGNVWRLGGGSDGNGVARGSGTADQARAGQARADQAWADRRGWRLGRNAWIHQRLRVGGQTVDVGLRSSDDGGWDVTLDGSSPVRITATSDDDGLTIHGPAGPVRVAVAARGSVIHVANGYGSWGTALDTSSTRDVAGVAGSVGPVRSPMPGTVLELRVMVGEPVVAGQALAVVEAMKMEHTLVASGDGIVASVDVHVGQQVALDEVIVTIGPPSVAPKDAS